MIVHLHRCPGVQPQQCLSHPSHSACYHQFLLRHGMHTQNADQPVLTGHSMHAQIAGQQLLTGITVALPAVKGITLHTRHSRTMPHTSCGMSQRLCQHRNTDYNSTVSRHVLTMLDSVCHRFRTESTHAETQIADQHFLTEHDNITTLQTANQHFLTKHSMHTQIADQ